LFSLSLSLSLSVSLSLSLVSLSSLPLSLSHLLGIPPLPHTCTTLPFDVVLSDLLCSAVTLGSANLALLSCGVNPLTPDGKDGVFLLVSPSVDIDALQTGSDTYVFSIPYSVPLKEMFVKQAQGSERGETVCVRERRRGEGRRRRRRRDVNAVGNKRLHSSQSSHIDS